MPVRLLSFILISLNGLFAAAQESNLLHVSTNKSTYKLLAGPQFSKLSLETGELSGFGLAIGASALLGHKFAATMILNQAYGQGGMQALFSGILVGASYAVLGQYGESEETIEFNRQTVASIGGRKRWTVSVGGGFDQYWLNGSEAVYAASGVAGFISAEVPLYGGLWLQPEIRFSSLSTGSQGSITANSIQIFFQYEM